MKMRAFVAGLALLACAACGPAGPPQAAGEGGYTLRVVATDAEQSYVVTTPDGKNVAARVHDGASEIIPAEQTLALVSDRLGVVGGDVREQVSMNILGAQVWVAGDNKADGGRARVAASAGGREVLVDTHNEPGDGGESTVVQIAHADEAATREFVQGGEGLSADVKAQMLRELGL